MTGGKLDLLSKWLEKTKQLGDSVINLSLLLSFITFPFIYFNDFFFSFQHFQIFSTIYDLSLSYLTVVLQFQPDYVTGLGPSLRGNPHHFAAVPKG